MVACRVPREPDEHTDNSVRTGVYQILLVIVIVLVIIFIIVIFIVLVIALEDASCPLSRRIEHQAGAEANGFIPRSSQTLTGCGRFPGVIV